ncbi:HNH endonuclease signature motif containing protein [Kineobactrum sediminis]|nr:HNH endonuclease signature motif containing protein [Kineobactrum sediminis]
MGMPVVVEDRPERLTGAQLGQAITLLSAQINAANHRLLKMIAEFDRRGDWREQGAMRSCAHWLVANCGITLGAAREKMRVARQLHVLPEVDEVFSEGGISYSKVRAITRVATPENQGFMVHLAQQNSAGHLEKLVSRYEPVAEPGLAGLLEAGQEEVATAGVSCDEAESGAAPELDAEAMRELARELYWFQDQDGMWIIHAKLPPEQGQLVMKALQAVVRPLEEERHEEWKTKQKARMQAVARKILQRGGTKAAASAEDGAESADPCSRAVSSVSQNLDAGTHSNGATRGLSAGAIFSGASPSLGAVAPSGSAGRSLHAEVTAGRESRHDIEALSGASSPTESSENSDREGVPDHVAYARAEKKISAETFSQHMNQVRADALVAVVEHFLASGPDYRGLQGLKGSERCQVVMHVDINTLREQRSGVCCSHGRAHFEDKPWLSPSTARRLSCDASLVTVLEDDAGKVLNVDRKSRIVPGPIRRALRERDGVCQYPGCQESEYVDAHHIRHWAEGGETRLNNLVTLCRFHHRQLHRGCFDIRLNGVSAEIFSNC